MNNNVVSEVKRYVAIQSALIGKLCEICGMPDKFLINIPERGVVQLGDDEWKFNKHGLGIRFVDQNGVVVDAHSSLDDPSHVDAWRVSTYLTSIGWNSFVFDGQIYETNERDVARLLSEICNRFSQV